MSARNLSTPNPPPQTLPPSAPAPSRLLSWLVTSVIIGWAVAYNIVRIGGRSPRGSAVVSLLIGLGIGAVIFAVTLVVWRTVVRGARYRATHMDELPPASRLDQRQRTALDMLWPAVGVLAVLLLVTGVAMLRTWLQTEGTRSMSRLFVGGWDLLLAVWLAFETRMLRLHDGEAVESIGTSGLLSAVLAGVALSMDQERTLQGGLIVIATVTAALAYHAGWRLLGGRGVPFAALGALAVGTASLVLPLVG